jgi:hypothetical protein
MPNVHKSELGKPKVSFRDAYREYHQDETVSLKNIKPEGLVQNFESKVDSDLATLDTVSKEKLKEYYRTYGGRIKYHLFRLLSDERKESGVERDFGLAYLNHSQEYLDELAKSEEARLETAGDNESFNRENERLLDVLGAESSDATMFWTFAPYLHKFLKEKGLSDPQAVKKILQWGRTGQQPNYRDSSVERTIHLKGLEFLNDEVRQQYYLTKNPMGASHLFTAQEAEKIVNEILLRTEGKG